MGAFAEPRSKQQVRYKIPLSGIQQCKFYVIDGVAQRQAKERNISLKLTKHLLHEGSNVDGVLCWSQGIVHLPP